MSSTLEGREVDREVVERVAYICGPHSGAARSLRQAEEWGESVAFFQTSVGIVVVKRAALSSPSEQEQEGEP